MQLGQEAYSKNKGVRNLYSGAVIGFFWSAAGTQRSAASSPGYANELRVRPAKCSSNPASLGGPLRTRGRSYRLDHGTYLSSSNSFAHSSSIRFRASS